MQQMSREKSYATNVMRQMLCDKCRGTNAMRQRTNMLRDKCHAASTR
jgi:hypothetical protein